MGYLIERWICDVLSEVFRVCKVQFLRISPIIEIIRRTLLSFTKIYILLSQLLRLAYRQLSTVKFPSLIKMYYANKARSVSTNCPLSLLIQLKLQKFSRDSMISAKPGGSSRQSTESRSIIFSLSSNFYHFQTWQYLPEHI